jgi:hypothetical protein
MNLKTALSLALLLVSAVAEAQTTHGQVTGRTVDESGAPIPGVFVTVRPAAPAAGLVEREALSDETGRVWFDDIPPGSYRVAGHLFGSHLALANIEVPVTGRTEVSLVMAIAPITECVVVSPGPPIEFRTKSGEQLPTAYVTVTREGRRPRSVWVMPTGQPDFCSPPEAADQVTLDVLGYGEHLLKRAGVDPAKVTWRRAIEPTAASRAARKKPGQPLGQVRGRVFDEYGASIPDATIVFTALDPDSGVTEFGTTADSRGRFDFGGVRTGTYRVTCRALGYETSVAIQEVKPGVQTEVTMTMRPVK